MGGRENAEVLKCILPTSFPQSCAASSSLCCHSAWGLPARPTAEARAAGWGSPQQTLSTHSPGSWQPAIRCQFRWGPSPPDCGPLAPPPPWEGPGALGGLPHGGTDPTPGAPPLPPEHPSCHCLGGWGLNTRIGGGGHSHSSIEFGVVFGHRVGGQGGPRPPWTRLPHCPCPASRGSLVCRVAAA